MTLAEINNCLRMACTTETLLRGLRLGAVVGTLLMLINHSDRLLDGDAPHPLKILLTYCVPVLVSVWTSVSKDLAAARHSD